MRDPNLVLNALSKNAENNTYSFKRLYRNLYNQEFFLAAYGKLAGNAGNMTKGTDGKTISNMSLSRINNLIETLKDESYQPSPVRRVYIDKKNGDKRPLGIPSFDDKLVQEVARNILESIYDVNFSDKSHGFRPKRSCHTALVQIQRKFTGTKWFVEGDIKGFFNNIDHTILINILRKKIKDERFINLIWKFLRAGYLENWEFRGTYSGTPQGGIISPILSNIYLNELDKYIDEYVSKFNKGKNRERNPEWRSVSERIRYRKKQLSKKWENLSDEQRKQEKAIIKEWYKEMYSLPSKNPMDEDFKRINYVRYADDFLIGVIGSKEDANSIKLDLAKFLREKLNLELSMEKTLITHASKKVRFLGYDLYIKTKAKSRTTNSLGNSHRNNSQKIQLMMPFDKWRDKLVQLEAIKIFSKDGKERWKSRHRKYLLSRDKFEIMLTYNAEIRDLYNYYKLAVNVCNLDKFKYFMEYSMYKTYARKWNTTVAKITKKYKQNGVFQLSIDTSKGKKTRSFYNDGFKRVRSLEVLDDAVDKDVGIVFGTQNRTGLIKRLMASKCEWCGEEDEEMHVHHVRKLKDLKGKKQWEIRMIGRNRKTMVLCTGCHKKLHSGKLD